MLRALRMLRLSPLLLIVALATDAALVQSALTPDRADRSWTTKVSPAVLSAVDDQHDVEFIVFLREQADLSAAQALATKEEKGYYVYTRLTNTAFRSQAELRQQLAAAGTEYRSYWIANMIWVRGGRNVLEAMASHPSVTAIFANPPLTLDPSPLVVAPDAYNPLEIEQNIAKIRAPDVWALGATGQGVVVGGQDTGYDWQHPALISQYRGWNDGETDHNYNWHDAIHSEGGTCGPDVAEPCDDHGHGTHTMGTIVGDDGGVNQIGVAPDAEWIGCRNMNAGVGSPVTYSECFQWFVAPTDINGDNPKPDLAPHVINNSWACPPAEDCTDVNVLQAVVENVRAAGIVIVTSAGNTGPNCGTVNYPPAIYDASLSVGAVTIVDVIASFSSRGPVTVDGSNRLKPEIVAPGVSIRSSLPGGSYGFSSGTSMASPHVAGLVALLISTKPTLAGNVDALEAAVMNSATPLTSDQECGGVAGTAVPNHTFGYGRIDALAAYSLVSFPFWYYAPAIVTE